MTDGQRTTVPTSPPGVYVGPDENPDAYQLVRLIGAGGEAQVWRAVTRPDPTAAVGIPVAVKVFSRDLPAEAAADWLRRTQAIRHVHNPGLAVVHAAFVGRPMHPWGAAADAAGGPCRYLVMELVDGPSLQDWLEDNPQATLRDRLRLLLTAAAGLDALHAGGPSLPPVAHGDVKPDNARLTPDGGVKLVDFGLMRMRGTSRQGPPMASPLYTAPEFFHAGEYAMPTPETDRFSFAVTAFQVLTGVLPPLRADGCGPDPAVMRQVLEQSPLTAGHPEVVSTVMAGLAPNPVDRPDRLVPWLAGARQTTSVALPPHGAAAPSPTGATKVLGAPAWDAPPPAGPDDPTVALPTWAVGSFPDQGAHQPAPRSRRRRRLAGVAVAVALVALLAAALNWVLPSGSGTAARDGDRTAGASPKPSGTGPASTGTADGGTRSSGGSAVSPEASGPAGSSGSAGSASAGSSPSTGAASPATRIPRSVRRSLEVGTQLRFVDGVIGDGVNDYDAEWGELPDKLYFSLARRVAVAPGITDAAGCRAALAAREDGPFVEIETFRAGKVACALTARGDLVEVRVVSVDPVSSAAVVEYRVF
ncbi:serine/threonine-protein kinase [Kineosporia sp. R_H_3]|uniref:serine/threonine-protein kinase n=1 Tax=Kineosporia sp. R_H_3 TaxID=1961848 RepID=UPI001304780B|nr:serine/threonine-protein kinase [Kineosporia sp. R_H_3]